MLRVIVNQCLNGGPMSMKTCSRPLPVDEVTGKIEGVSFHRRSEQAV